LRQRQAIRLHKQPAAPAAPAAPAQEQPGQVTAPVTPAAPAQEQPGADDWEHKYKSQEGRVRSQNQTIGQLREQIAEMGSELSRATQFIEQVQAQQNAPAPTRLITADEETTYGEDLINVARKAARETLDPEVQGLKQQVNSLQQTLQQTAQRGVHATLTQEVPDWKTINRSQNFSHWLGLRDPLSGVIRKVLLDGAFRAADAARVVAIFKGFVAEDAASRPAAPAPLTPAPEIPAPATPAVSLVALAAPGRARSVPATSATTEKSTYTTRQISKFYDDSRKGLWAGREAEKLAIEQDIYLAQREGRVIG
jgi:hypothetical protein